MVSGRFWKFRPSESEIVVVSYPSPQAYHEQVDALGTQGVALVETLKVIGEKGVRITPDVLASGSTGDGAGGLRTLLLLNLSRAA